MPETWGDAEIESLRRHVQALADENEKLRAVARAARKVSVAHRARRPWGLLRAALTDLALFQHRGAETA